MPKLGLPLYPTKLRAVIDFLELDQKIYSVSSKILIILPDFRSKIRELRIAGKELSISVQSQSEHSLIGKFYNSKDNEKGISSPDILVTDNVANYEASFEPDYVRAVLMDSSSGKMVDEKVYKGRYSLQDGVLVTTTSDYIRERIRNGENETTEFKLSIDNELMETVDSFANTNGGLIILGVEDKGNIRGFIYVPGNESIIEKKIQGLVKSHCEPSIDLRFEWINLDNKSLLLVYISQGNDKPYLVRDKGIYIREREHDYIVNRLQLDKLYESHSSLSPLNYES